MTASATTTTQVTEQTMVVADADTLIRAFDSRSDQIREARLKGYEGDACGEYAISPWSATAPA
jgi:hypothetical protein